MRRMNPVSARMAYALVAIAVLVAAPPAHADSVKVTIAGVDDQDLPENEILVVKDLAWNEGMLCGDELNHEQVAAQQEQPELDPDFRRGEPVDLLTAVEEKLQ